MKRTHQLIALLTLAAVSAVSQAQTPATDTPRVDQRAANQQERISQGAANGSLTPRETEHLEKQQAKIENTEAKDKAKGYVTPKEKRHLAHMQNKASKNIHKDKTNDKVAG